MLYRIILSFFITALVFPGSVFAKTSSDPFVFQDAYELIGAYKAWDITTGSSDVVVAIIDNGIDMYHPDLVDNIWKNIDEVEGNGIDDDANGFIDDVWGWNFLNENNDPRPVVDGLDADDIKQGVFNHGTVVAGIIGARGNNELDGSGINWRVRLMNLKVIGNEGIGSLVPLGSAIRYAVDNGAHIINISMVSGENIQSIQNAITYAKDHGVLVVAAAGNNSAYLNDDPYYPICTDATTAPSVIGVSAITNEKRLARFSNQGSSCIDITAPGVSIASTIRFSPTNGLAARYGGGYNGTSFAAPMVSGAAALIKSIQPTWGATEITYALLSNTHHSAGQDEKVYANLYGKGLLQIDKALAYAAGQPSAKLPVAIPAVSDIAVLVAPPASEEVLVVAPKEIQPVWIIDQKNGVVQVIKNGTSEEVARAELKDIYDIVAFAHDGKKYLATAKKLNKKQAVVTIYDDQWKKVTSWNIPYANAVSFAAGNMNSDSGIEIVVAPRAASKTLFEIYSFKGKKLLSKNIPDKHAGVSLAMTDGGVAALYKAKNGYAVSVVNGAGSILRTFPISWLRTAGGLFSHDINGDGTRDFVVTGGKGQDPTVGYYTSEGESLRQLFAYDPSYAGGVETVATDADGDAVVDIFVAPIGGVEGVRQLSETGKMIQEWPTFGKNGSVSLNILIQPFPLTK